MPVPWEQWLEATKKKPLDFTPGENFKYANSGYILLGFIIERVSGKSYGEFLQENIFTPLQIKQTGYEDPHRIIKNRATGYRQLPGDPITNVPYAEMIGLYAAGGIYSTTEDLLLWDKVLYTDKLLSGKSLDEMSTPFKEMLPGKGYAYGWWTSVKFGRQEVAHGGNLAGFITYSARFPSERVTVIVWTDFEYHETNPPVKPVELANLKADNPNVVYVDLMPQAFGAARREAGDCEEFGKFE